MIILKLKLLYGKYTKTKLKKNKPNYIYIVYIYICKPYNQQRITAQNIQSLQREKNKQPENEK